MNGSLHISEVFYSLQGEGRTMGIPSVFIRLSGCNLLCQSKSWVCDTIEVWRKGTKTNFEDVLTESQIDRIKNGAHIVFTGGEPLLHQKQIVLFYEWLCQEYGFRPIVEVETNGTISPGNPIKDIVNYWNVSPKLANSGESYERRVNNVAIQYLSLMPSIFKFVVEKKEDVVDIMQDYGDFIDMSKVMLMPAGETQEKLNKTRPIVAEMCVQMGLRYCDRLHIVIWNQKTGV